MLPSVFLRCLPAALEPNSRYLTTPNQESFSSSNGGLFFFLPSSLPLPHCSAHFYVHDTYVSLGSILAVRRTGEAAFSVALNKQDATLEAIRISSRLFCTVACGKITNATLQASSACQLFLFIFYFFPSRRKSSQCLRSAEGCLYFWHKRLSVRSPSTSARSRQALLYKDGINRRRQ